MPLPASTAAKLEAARAAALQHVQQAEDSYSASASFEEASISPRASYGDASFESESPRASPRTLSPRVSPSPSPEPARPAAAAGRQRCVDRGRGRGRERVRGLHVRRWGPRRRRGVRGSRTPCSGAAANADAPARGAVDASEDSMFGAAGAAPARRLGRRRPPRRPRPRADDRSESASASDSSGDVSFAEDSEGDAPAPARRPQTIDALFDSDGSEPLGAPAAAAAPAHVPAAGRAAARPGRIIIEFPTLPGMVAAPAADDGDDPPSPAWRRGRTRTTTTVRTGASSRTGTTATTAAARHDDGFNVRCSPPPRWSGQTATRPARCPFYRSDDARLDAPIAVRRHHQSRPWLWPC